MKELEIERKYLLRPCSPEDFLQSIGLKYHSYLIMQYYVPPLDGGYIRYRQRNQEFFKTIKRGEGMVKEEYESSVTKEEFDSNLENHTGNIIEKERFVFIYDDMTYEMDRFKKTLNGLCYLEIEFDDEETAREFILPEVFSGLYLSEVTEDQRFNNSSISKSSSIPTLDTNFDILAKKVTHALNTSKHLTENAENISFEPYESIFLEPYESTIVAIQSIFMALTMRLDKERKRLLKNSNTPEALHQFRVSIRRIRSVMDIFKAFLLPHWYALHRRNLSFLMTQTNSSRDRDVLLKQLPFYRSLLPDDMQKGLIPLQELLLKKKEVSDNNLLVLAENELLKYEITSLLRPGIKHYSSGEAVNQPIVITAMQIVENRVNNIIKKGKILDLNSTDEEYHKLRIKYKKLRYFTETMQSLANPKKYKESVRSMKKIQTILGDLNDYQVQQSLLLSLSDEPELQGDKSKNAMDLLDTKLEEFKKKKEELFKKKFIEMLEYKKRIKHLFEVD